MKIVYIIDKPNMYGSEQHLLDILRYFSKTDEITLITFSEGEMLNYIPKMSLKIINMKWFPNFKNLVVFYKYIKEINPDLIHCHQPKALFFGTIIGKILGIKTIITIHSQPYDHATVHRNILKKFIVYLFHSLVSLMSKFLTTKIIYVNHRMYEISYFKNKSIVITNWLKSSIRQGLPKNIISNKINFLTVGSTTYPKGFDILIDFFILLKKKEFNFSAKVYGEVHNEFIKNINIPDEVQLCGFNNNLIDEYTNANIFVLFSRTETFGLSYLEAMSQGLPIICLDLEELRGLIPPINCKVKDIYQAFECLLKLIEKENYEIVSKINIEESQKYSYIEKMKKINSLYKYTTSTRS